MNEKRQDSEVQMWMIGKYVVLAIVIAFAIWMFRMQQVSGVGFDTICENLETSGFMDNMEEVSAEEAQTLLNIPEEYCREFYYAATPEQGDVEEMLIVQTDSDRNSERVVKLLENYLDRQAEKYQETDAAQTALLKEAVIKRQGSYVFYVVSEERDFLVNRFLKNLK
jgi:hypothetical protein